MADIRKIRVCELITELEPAGAERVVYELATRMDKERFDVQVIGLQGGRVADWLEKAGVKVTNLGVRGKWDVGKLFKLTDILREENLDIVHTHMFHGDLAGRIAARLAAVPHVVHTVHVAEGRFRPWQFAFARFAGDFCEKIICVSESVRDYHSRRSGLPKSSYEVIENGVDLNAFTRDENRRRELRQEWGIENGEVLVASVGRLNKQKGIDTLIGAMSHLGARGNPVNIVIAGEGPRRFVVENFISHGEGGKHCRLLGFTRDVQGLLSAADILAMPSNWEGFGLAATEAMAVGLPVIATRVPGLRDVVKDGETGILIDRKDVVGLAEAIHQLSEDADMRQKLGQAGRRRVAEKYSIESNIAIHEQLYQKIVKQTD